MKKTLLILALIAAANLFAQQQQDSILVRKIPTIIENANQQRQEINSLTKKLNNQQYFFNQQKKGLEKINVKSQNQGRLIDSLNQVILVNKKNIQTNSNELGTEIEKVTSATNSQISELDSNLDKNRLYWIIATLATLLLGGLVYWLLGKRIQSSKIDVETQIKNTKNALEEESVKLDNKLVDILETQLKVKQEESKAQPISSSTKEDHSLALKVADEVVRMQKNISKMDSSTKGIKPLLKGIERIQNNFAANGYEMINHMNKEYDDRMNIDVINFVSDENSSSNRRIISRIIKPQVNFKGVLIQRAQVDVSHN
jgi:hypothetical protein